MKQASWVSGVLVVASLGFATRAAADYGLRQITTTSGCDSNGVRITADGTRVAFKSSCNLAGGTSNPNGELYLADTITNAVTRITTTTGCLNLGYTISSDAMRVALISSCDLTGLKPKPGSYLYLFDASTSTFTQITKVPDCVAATPVISGDGTRIAFVAPCDPTGTPGGDAGLYLFDTTTSAFTPIITDSGCGSSQPYSAAPVISGDGMRVAFVSDCTVTGNTDQNQEIYLYDVSTKTITQVTKTAQLCFNANASINADGTRIAFDSACLGENREISIFDSTTGGTTPITATDGCDNVLPLIDALGTHIVLQSSCNLAGTGVNQRNFFRFDAATPGVFSEIFTPNCSVGNLAINADASRVALASACNLTGDNGGNVEVYVATFLTPTPTPTPRNTRTPTPTITPRPTPSATATITATATLTATPLSPPTPSASATPSGTPTAAPTATNTATPDASATPTRPAAALSTALSLTDDFIAVSNIDQFPASGVVMIDAEQMTYGGRQLAATARAATQVALPQAGLLLHVQRGANGTTPAAHAAGAPVVLISAGLPCVGDCSGNGEVTVNELLAMVNVALGNAEVTTCIAGDANGDAQITINEILAGVNNALGGCTPTTSGGT